jgi:hypothetical protein
MTKAGLVPWVLVPSRPIVQLSQECRKNKGSGGCGERVKRTSATKLTYEDHDVSRKAPRGRLLLFRSRVAFRVAGDAICGWDVKLG